MNVLAKRSRNRIGRPFRTLVSDVVDTEEFFHGDRYNNLSVLPMNVKETKQDFKIEIAAPGMHKEDFKIDIDNGILRVSAEREERSEENDEDYIRKEFSKTSFGQSFSLPESINSEKIGASYKEGVLYITLTKKEESQKIEAKSITID